MKLRYTILLLVFLSLLTSCIVLTVRSFIFADLSACGSSYSPYQFSQLVISSFAAHFIIKDPAAGSDYRNASSLEGLLPPPHLTLQELFSNRTPTAFPSHFPFLSPSHHPNFTTHVLPYPKHHKQFTLRNVCIEPSGRLLLVNATAGDIGEPRRPGGPKKMPWCWYLKYINCGNVTGSECVGVRSTFELPTYARYVPGNTLHFVAYDRGNTLHNFAERIWPRLALSVSPFNETTEGFPLHHFFFHRIDQLLQQSSYLDDKDQNLWQFRMLMELWPGADLLRVGEGEDNATMCFDRLHLQMQHDDRMDHSDLPPAIFGPAVRNYKAATFRFLGLPTPVIPLPPRPLRLLLYCRTELSRRRALNHDQVLHFLLHNMSRLNLEVRSLDLLIQSKQIDYTFTPLVTLFSQTDILVVAHGAMTLSAMYMPFRAGIVEIFGSCDWWKPKDRLNDSTIPMNSWVAPLMRASYIKHDLSNPFGESVANPKRGNTTLCIHPGKGVPDFTIDLPKLAHAIDSFAYPQGPGDRLTLHWLYDWGHVETPSMLM